MKKMKKVTAMALTLLMLISIMPPDVWGTNVHAAGIHNSHFETTYLNPLYEDVLTEDDLVPSSQQSANAADADDRETTFYTPYGAGLQMRPGLVDRDTVITVNVYLEEFAGTQAAFSDLCLDVVTYAMMHTGMPTEGDYLKWQFGGYGASAQYRQNGDGLHLLTIEFTFTYYTDAAQEAELDAAVTALLSQLDVANADSYTKLEAIYDYICTNVVYDHENVDNESYKLKYTAYAAMIDGVAVCQGYSLLLYRLALELDVDCRLISGYGGGPHAWNIAEVDSLYYNMDPTWDAGKNDYAYFLRCPSNFTGHTRDSEYDTADFHNLYPMAEEDYTYCNHSYESVITTDPTCTMDGVMTYTCLLCGYAYTDIIPAAGHSFGKGEITVPTCTNQGFTTFTCVVCGDTHFDNYTDALGHNYGEWVTTQDPTCISSGSQRRDCERCDEFETEELAALGHDFEDVVTEPTCTEGGYTTHTCVCGESYKDTYTDALGHDLIRENEIPATCTEPGYQSSASCSRCDHTEGGGEIPALGHTEAIDAAVAPTCTETGLTEGMHCSVCNEVLVAQETVAALGHDWSGICCTRCDATRVNPFTDVPNDSLYIDPILWAVEKNITTGATPTTFNPNGDCLRAQVVTFLWRAAGEPEPTSNNNPFTDVKESDYFYKAVLWAVEEGITTGATLTNFDPNGVCQRAHVVAFLWRAAGEPKPTSNTNPFTDAKESNFFYDAVMWAVEEGITTGATPTAFNPYGNCLRAQIVTFLYRFYNK